MRNEARLQTPKVTAKRSTAPASGMQTLQLKGGTSAFIYAPSCVTLETKLPVLMYLHGSGGRAEDALLVARMAADHYKFIVICPQSADYTWDVIARGRFGADVQTIQQCLDAAARDFNVDFSRVGLSGFSDGASYALSLGLTNGDVFSHIIALSPGYFFTKHPVGRPAIYVCHGVNDNVLSIDRCSRRIAPQLINAGYPVEYREFGGGHLVRPDVLRTALLWFLGKNRVARQA